MSPVLLRLDTDPSPAKLRFFRLQLECLKSPADMKQRISFMFGLVDADVVKQRLRHRYSQVKYAYACDLKSQWEALLAELDNPQLII